MNNDKALRYSHSEILKIKINLLKKTVLVSNGI